MRSVDPRLVAVAGAACLSVSALFVEVSGVSGGTAAWFRCVLALPVLVPLALVERRRSGVLRRRWVDVLAGLLLGVDLVLWGESIAWVGAGIATVLVNLQVVVLPALALVVFGERLSWRFAVSAPVMLVGVALAAGLADGGRSGGNALVGVLYGAGAGVTYAGYLFLSRLGGGGQGHRFARLSWATVAAGAAAVLVGGPWHGVDLVPGWAAFWWLVALALSGQVLGWLLIGAALPRLRVETGGALLLSQPVLAVVLGVVFLAERPSVVQVVGCVLVVAAVWSAGRGPAAGKPGAGGEQGCLACRYGRDVHPDRGAPVRGVGRVAGR